jgi:hypothetical protein
MPKAVVWLILAVLFGALMGVLISQGILPIWLGVGAAAAAGLFVGVFVFRPLSRRSR